MKVDYTGALTAGTIVIASHDLQERCLL